MNVRVAPLLLLACVACEERSSPRSAGVGTGGPGGPDVAAVDTTLRQPRVVRAPTVIVFWLDASDTLHPEAAAAAYDELTLATERIAQPLAAFDIALVPTQADTVFLERVDEPRRAIRLSGLAFPFGFVLLEPGGLERVLAGLLGEAELLEEIRVYFDLPDDTTGTPSRVITE